MRHQILKSLGSAAAAVLLLLNATTSSNAFPPAPDHIFYGMVRDEMGNPIAYPGAEVVMETSAGLQLKALVINGAEEGSNYKLAIPMDAGITDDVYKPTALRPTVPFKMWVRINEVRYLPIQMKGDYSQLGQPGQRTRLDLTLGEDLDGDGLPDAWERALISVLGGGKTLADINSADDSDGDGLSNLQEYLAGTYAFDDKDGFTLKIIGTVAEKPVLEFMAIAGRSYRVIGSSDLKAWTDISFRTAGSTESGSSSYYSTDTRILKIEALNSGATTQFFKLLVQ